MTHHPRSALRLRAFLACAMVALGAPVAVAAAEAPAPPSEVAPEPIDEQATTASILIVNLDTRGTDDDADDTLLDGAEFEVYADDGDSVFQHGGETLVDGPSSTTGGMVDTADLPGGRYWIVQSTFPAGYMGAAPVLVELNLDPTVSCRWTATGPQGCDLNDQGSEHLSWTIAVIDNHPLPDPVETDAPTPTAPPSGGVGGATGRPGITLPPTDPVDGASASRPSTSVWVAFALLTGLAVGAGLLAPTRAARGRR